MPWTAHEIAAETSPSLISLIRAPVPRTSAISPSWRWPVEDDHRDVRDLAAQGLGDPVAVLRRVAGDVHAAGGDRPHGELLEVRVGGVGEAARLGGREHGERAALAGGDEVRALEGIHGDVHRREHAIALMAAHLLADVEHRRLVPLALADDDGPREVRLVHRLAHGLGCRQVRLVPGAAAHEPRGGDRRRLGDADHLEGEQLFHGCLRGWPVAEPSFRGSSAPGLSVAEVAAPREHHRQVVAVGDLDRHLVADGAAGLDDRRDPGVCRDLDPVREAGSRRRRP